MVAWGDPANCIAKGLGVRAALGHLGRRVLALGLILGLGLRVGLGFTVGLRCRV